MTFIVYWLIRASSFDTKSFIKNFVAPSRGNLGSLSGWTYAGSKWDI